MMTYDILSKWDIPVAIVTPLLEFLFFFWLVRAYKRSRKQSLYSYKNVALLACLIFMAFVMLDTVLALLPPHSAGFSLLEEVTNSFVYLTPRFSFIAVPVISVLFAVMTVSNIVLMKKEGFALHNMLGALLGIGLILTTLAFFYICDMLYTHVFFPIYAAGNDLVLILDDFFTVFPPALLCYVECLMLSMIILGWQVAHLEPAYDKDAVIILGCMIRKDGSPTPLLAHRVKAAYDFARRQEAATGKSLSFVTSGGQGKNEPRSEAAAMQDLLLSLGVPKERILLEDRSVNTLENMTFSREILEENMGQVKTAFATTNYHVLRGGIYARRVGLCSEGCAGKTRWYFWPNGFVREMAALLVEKRRGHLVNMGILALISLVIGLLDYLMP